jgi:hypothetical protein
MPSNSQLGASGEMTASISSQHGPKCIDEPGKSSEGAKIVQDPKVLEAKRELKKLLRSQYDKSDVPTDFAAKRHLILCADSGLKMIETSKELQESLKYDRMDDLINQECFNKVSDSKIYPVYNNNYDDITFLSILLGSTIDLSKSWLTNMKVTR